MSLKYRIGAIGWYNFETLSQTLLKNIIGPGVTSFGGTKDAGRDATFAGVANFPNDQTKWEGYWVFQVKYVDFEEQGVEAARKQLRNTFRKELRTVLAKQSESRTSKRIPDNYILITNVPLTGSNRDELSSLVQKADFQGNYAVIDGKEVCQFLDLVPQVRRSYPQLLGLADLDGILNREVYARSEAYVQQWQPRLATFVRADAYGEALTTLRSRHFVVLDGPPESGKSTIAAAFALQYAADGFEVVDIRGPDQIYKVYDTGRSQLFVADDAVGSVSLDPSLTDNWSRDLPGVLRKLDAKHLLIWTARSYVLEEAIAESRLGETIKGFPGIHEVLVEVGKLSSIQKAEILYNHAKQAHLPSTSRALLREKASKIADHPNFTPERIRQLVENVLPEDTNSKADETGQIKWEDIERFLRDPGIRWIQAYRKLTGTEQTLLTAMLDFDSQTSLGELKRAYELHGEQLDRKIAFEDCVNRLKHSFLRVTSLYTREYIDFQHPSLRDMLLSQLRDVKLARCRYIRFASPTGLSNLIRGVALSSIEQKGDDHLLLPKNDEELTILLDRLKEVSSGPLSVNDWQALLSAADLLVPREPSKGRASFENLSPKLQNMLSPSDWAHLRSATRTRVPPSQIDLGSFRQSPQGLVLEAVLRAFGSYQTLERNQRYDPNAWANLLEKYYDLTAYLIPPPRAEFVYGLAQKLPQMKPKDAIHLAAIISRSEPVIISQVVTGRLLRSWNDYIIETVQNLIRNGEDLSQPQDDEDEPCPDTDEYSTWFDEVEGAMTLAEEFYEWSRLERPDEIGELEQLKESVELPSEPDQNEDDDDRRTPPQAYWTIERMFEDL